MMAWYLDETENSTLGFTVTDRRPSEMYNTPNKSLLGERGRWSASVEDRSSKYNTLASGNRKKNGMTLKVWNVFAGNCPPIGPVNELDWYFEVLNPTEKVGEIWQKSSKFIVERSCATGRQKTDTAICRQFEYKQTARLCLLRCWMVKGRKMCYAGHSNFGCHVYFST